MENLLNHFDTQQIIIEQGRGHTHICKTLLTSNNSTFIHVNVK